MKALRIIIAKSKFEVKLNDNTGSLLKCVSRGEPEFKDRGCTTMSDSMVRLGVASVTLTT